MLCFVFSQSAAVRQATAPGEGFKTLAAHRDVTLPDKPAAGAPSQQEKFFSKMNKHLLTVGAFTAGSRNRKEKKVQMNQ
ncbi:uncharacterized [Tachysurus ichikawai]